MEDSLPAPEKEPTTAHHSSGDDFQVVDKTPITLQGQGLRPKPPRKITKIGTSENHHIRMKDSLPASSQAQDSSREIW
jgi:hypothetical protein